MEKFRAFKLTEADRKIEARFVDCTLDELDPGDVVIRVAYSDVNYKDALAATGKGLSGLICAVYARSAAIRGSAVAHQLCGFR